MPQCVTKYHGNIEYQDEQVFQFPQGLPGFAGQRRFVPVEHPSTRPILFLQSLDTPELCFITLPVLVVNPAYRLAVSEEDLALLQLPTVRQPAIGTDVLCLAILTIQPHCATTANLLAPVVVNLRNRIAVQAVATDTSYSHQYPFLEPRQDREPEEVARCS